ncbi:MAG: hypothetical protein QNJ35_13260 [Paracoccaceae bacterium]|nr:hypothetical protein [Paracoccaceae bacterium]
MDLFPKQAVQREKTGAPKLSFDVATRPDPPQDLHGEVPEPWQRWHRRLGVSSLLLRCI